MFSKKQMQSQDARDIILHFYQKYECSRNALFLETPEGFALS